MNVRPVAMYVRGMNVRPVAMYTATQELYTWYAYAMMRIYNDNYHVGKPLIPSHLTPSPRIHASTQSLPRPHTLIFSQDTSIEFSPTIVLAGAESDSVDFKYSSTQAFQSTTVALNSSFSVTDVSTPCMQHISTFAATTRILFALRAKVQLPCCLGGVRHS